ncbi:phosphatase PAP2 family protein [Maribellus comscasis]|uniref:Phosphatase PAP2 family protein n=1 Tax=Maribellus comscasis TaxID=2681766 RepID=A0A6I6JSG5_9BACT|nr:phosphatase PAP2 family protein [Maribellus comscasis]QGY44040.1 phosphatase PAP2 family protein [Maribellus comscasis]
MKRCQTLIILFFTFFFLKSINTAGQSGKDSTVYKINRKIEAPVTIGLFGASFLGFEYLRNKPRLEYSEVIQLSADDIWWFDRPATRQSVSFRHRAHDISDFFLNSSVILPGLLALDQKIRNDWLDLLILYGESHAINTDFYLLTASSVLRTRPFNYNPDVPVEDKLASETRNSFFSGHVSTAATASFFMAKVYSDYHPEIGNKKYLLFAAAVIPPALVGYYRFKAMKHFPTDILTGFVVGASAGILIPELHRIQRKNPKLSLIPFTGNYNGLRLSYVF